MTNTYGIRVTLKAPAGHWLRDSDGTITAYPTMKFARAIAANLNHAAMMARGTRNVAATYAAERAS